MSQSMFLGVKHKLNKVNIGKDEIFCIPDLYKNSFYFKEGVLFDENLNEDVKNFFNKSFNDYNWYEVKSLPLPLEASPRFKDDMPDLYEASKQTSEWFYKFVKKLEKQGNEVVVVNLWINNKEQKAKVERKQLSLNLLDLGNFEAERDILYELKT